MTNNPIFVTGRFRSGTTLLWNFFHRCAGTVAWYEPLNDCLLPGIRHTRPMESHRRVDDYWESYAGIEEELTRLHRRSFAFDRLLLEEDARWDELEEYVGFLLRTAGGRRAVLQFNRIDFRLPWIRRHFPGARILHIFRDPRQSWASMRSHLPPAERDDPFHPDSYDLFQWAAALAPHFPFLFEREATGYSVHYYLWQLSRMQGEASADLSLSFDDDVLVDPAISFGKLRSAGLVEESDDHAFRGAVERPSPHDLAEFHEPAWFEAIEKRCRTRLEELGLIPSFGTAKLEEIRAKHRAAWARLEPLEDRRIASALLDAISRQRAELTRLLGVVREREEAGAGGAGAGDAGGNGDEISHGEKG